MKKSNSHDAKPHLSKLIQNKSVRQPGGWESKVVIEKDFDILPEEFMLHFQNHEL